VHAHMTAHMNTRMQMHGCRYTHMHTHTHTRTHTHLKLGSLNFKFFTSMRSRLLPDDHDEVDGPMPQAAAASSLPGLSSGMSGICTISALVRFCCEGGEGLDCVRVARRLEGGGWCDVDCVRLRDCSLSWLMAASRGPRCRMAFDCDRWRKAAAADAAAAAGSLLPLVDADVSEDADERESRCIAVRKGRAGLEYDRARNGSDRQWERSDPSEEDAMLLWRRKRGGWLWG